MGVFTARRLLPSIKAKFSSTPPAPPFDAALTVPSVMTTQIPVTPWLQRPPISNAWMPAWVGPITPEHKQANDVSVSYPDWVQRPAIPIAAHPAFFPSLRPEHTIALDAKAIFPDRIDVARLPV